MAHRYWITPGDWGRDAVTLDPEESHHLVRVVRAPPGARIAVFDGAGHTGSGEIQHAARGRVTVRILERTEEPAPALPVTLFQALPKGQGFDEIVRKATELGVTEIVPLITDRVVLRLDPAKAETRRGRWQRIALEAAKQCDAAWVPHVAEVTDLQGVAARAGAFDLLLVGALQPDAPLLKDVLRARGLRHGLRVGLLIGPEGDLTPEELAAACRAGAVPVSFGRRILRVDTAAYFGLIALAYECLER